MLHIAQVCMAVKYEHHMISYLSLSPSLTRRMLEQICKLYSNVLHTMVNFLFTSSKICAFFPRYFMRFIGCACVYTKCNPDNFFFSAETTKSNRFLDTRSHHVREWIKFKLVIFSGLEQKVEHHQTRIIWMIERARETEWKMVGEKERESEKIYEKDEKKKWDKTPDMQLIYRMKICALNFALSRARPEYKIHICFQLSKCQYSMEAVMHRTHCFLCNFFHISFTRYPDEHDTIHQTNIDWAQQ